MKIRRVRVWHIEHNALSMAHQLVVEEPRFGDAASLERDLQAAAAHAKAHGVHVHVAGERRRGPLADGRRRAKFFHKGHRRGCVLENLWGKKPAPKHRKRRREKKTGGARARQP